MPVNVLLTTTILILYLAITILIGYWASRVMKVTPSDLFTANRSLGFIALVFAIFGSQITAFGMLGAPGAAYELGFSTLGYLQGMANFASAAGFYLIGYRAWLLAARYNFVTPVQFLGESRFGNDSPRFVVAALQILLTIPYILICGIGSGIAISAVTKGIIPYWLGALVILLASTYIAYSGGMRGTAWTNIFQGILMIGVLVFMMFIVYNALGKGTQIIAKLPDEMLSLGGKGVQRLGYWIPFSLLCTGISNGVVPHILVRNMSAESPRAIQLNVVIYPILMTIFMFMAITLGVWGSVGVPGLVGASVDDVMPMLAEIYAPPWMTGLLGAGILAAILSSLHGMLLVVSSIFSDDIVKPILEKGGTKLSSKQDSYLSRIFILIVAIVVYLLVLVRPATILAIAEFSFAGFATLFPAYFGCLYWKRASKWGVIVSSIIGVTSVALWAFHVLPEWTTFGTHYAAPGFILSVVLMVAVSLITRPAPKLNTENIFTVFDEVYES
ncbi:MAG: sodium:solute symporter family protein [Firmicutes bacterium]|nr:sodium:solute symporter family protein [Bacillota bacterium]